MPFIKQTISIDKPIKATLFLQNYLQISPKDTQRFIDKGRISINGEIFCQKSGILCGEIEILRFIPQDLGIEPMFKTPDFAIFDKPPKILSHPKGRFFHQSLLDSVRFHFGDSANIINRLDSQTSGLIMASINKCNEASLKLLFEYRQVKKCYLALVQGNLKSCEINLPIMEQHKKCEKKRDLGIRSIINDNGKPSITQVERIAYDKRRDTTLIKAYPLTGRTHQIRLHLSHIGHRILGDGLYGVSDNITRDFLDGRIVESMRSKILGANRLMLHSHSLEFCFKGVDYRIFSAINIDNFSKM